MKVNTKQFKDELKKMSDEELQQLLRSMLKIADKKGVAVVMCDDCLITTYSLF